MRMRTYFLVATTLAIACGSSHARFLSPDPVKTDEKNGTNFNRYWYGNNNPYKFVDPDGRYIVIAGDEEFQEETTNNLTNAGAAHPELARRLDVLNRSEYRHEIRPASENPEHPDQPENVTELGNGHPNESNGVGVGTISYYDPNAYYGEISETAAGSPTGVLTHEVLGHGFDKDQGILRRDINPETGNPKSEEEAQEAERIYVERNMHER